MDDKKFDAIMKDYVSSKSRGKDVDFSKLEERKKNKTPVFSNKKWVFASLAMVLVVVLSLSIALPLTLSSNPNNEQDGGGGDMPPEIQYFDNYEIEMNVVESVSVLRSQYGITAVFPVVECLDVGAKVITDKESGYVLGASLEMSVYDDYFDVISLYAVSSSIKLSFLRSYDDLMYETVWDGIFVKYYIQHNELDDNYTTRLCFAIDGYQYFLEVTYYVDLPIEDLLCLIY